MGILVTSKYEEDPIKIESATVAITLNIIFFQSKADNSAVRGRMWSKFEPIRDVTNVLVTFKNKEDPNKNEGA